MSIKKYDFNSLNYQKFGTILTKFLKNKENKVNIKLHFPYYESLDDIDFDRLDELSICTKEEIENNKIYDENEYYIGIWLTCEKNILTEESHVYSISEDINGYLNFGVFKDYKYTLMLNKKEEKQLITYLNNLEKLSIALTECKIPFCDISNGKLHKFIKKIHTSCKRRIHYHQ